IISFRFSLFATGYTLTCYNGFSVIRGQSVGTSQEECPNESDSCYRVVADVNLFSTVKKAGCSTYRCYLNRNSCVEQSFLGSGVQFCCCDGRDLCNAATRPHIHLAPSIALLISYLLFDRNV
uniref:UPAR/Ly6 domain-containing protein n=1 Tax=Parascaris equorum TaxID=6256 RepID=A0A914RFP3_PAREQ